MVERQGFGHGRFVLVMLVTVWLVQKLVGHTWLAVAVAQAVNLIISWPRRPKDRDEARPSIEVRAWSDPKPKRDRVVS